MHFLLSCTLYEDLRTELLTVNQWNDIHPVKLKALFLGETADQKKTDNLLKFIYTAYIRRERKVNQKNARKLNWLRIP